jgi:hypothetical protein
MATPEEILLSFEQSFGSTGTKINGVWKSHNSRLVEWLRDGKQYIDGIIPKNLKQGILSCAKINALSNLWDY